MKFARMTALGVLLVPTLFATSALAEVTFTIQRINNKEAIMTATGTPDLGNPTGPDLGRYVGLNFLGLLELESGSGPVFGSVEQSGDFSFGSVEVLGYPVIFSDMVGDGYRFLDDTAPAGSALLRITGGDIQWRQVGSTSRVLSTYVQFSPASTREVTIGNWVMVGRVPEPATWMTMIGGMAMVGAALRRRSAGAPAAG